MSEQSRFFRFHIASKIAIGILLGLALLAIWQLFFVQRSNPSSFWIWTNPDEKQAELQYPPLVAAGIELKYASQTPNLSREQALLTANQLKPGLAGQAEQIEARYVLLNYPAAEGMQNHPDLRDIPSWLVWYQRIPLQPTSAEVDPTPFPQSHHDLYLFIDAQDGQELLAVWV